MTGGETITVRRAGAPTGAKDRYGRDVLGADVETVYPGCLFAAAGSTETLALGRTQLVTRDSVYRRGDVDVTAADRVLVRGVEREVDGTPEQWMRGGRVVGVVIRLKMTEG
jgi:hypothetical protein